jgi:AraC-like DNA-binding protein/ligand-binding sensor protein
MTDLQGLTAYLNRIEREQGWEIVIDDFYGHLRIDSRFRSISLVHGIHRNRFCMKIKENRKLWDRCLEGKIPLLEACQRGGEIFHGCCFCGREEYILPIRVNNSVVGALSLGGFSQDENTSQSKLAHTAEKYAIDRAELSVLLEEASLLPAPSIAYAKEMLSIVTEYIALYYETMNLPLSRPVPQGVKTNRQYILAHGVEYIKQQYRENITVKDVAHFCHISESYINHNFKKYLGESVRSYLNRVRIDRAAELLLATDTPVTQIALDCGFGDPNYFSRIFSQRKGLSPRDYRKKSHLPAETGTSS